MNNFCKANIFLVEKNIGSNNYFKTTVINFEESLPQRMRCWKKFKSLGLIVTSSRMCFRWMNKNPLMTNWYYTYLFRAIRLELKPVQSNTFGFNPIASRVGCQGKCGRIVLLIRRLYDTTQNRFSPFLAK